MHPIFVILLQKETLLVNDLRLASVLTITVDIFGWNLYYRYVIAVCPNTV